VVGANALVTAGSVSPENSLVLGVPGKAVKQDEGFFKMAQKNAEIYQNLAKKHLEDSFEYYKH
jgi:carbonic anhydrase/acetyltransferase-like protein (isoleucine patch superfamily)